MKKILAIAVSAMLIAACTYKSDVVWQRTSENLASMNVELIRNSTVAALFVLYDIDVQHKDTILTAAFDTLVTSESFYQRFGSSAVEMDIQRTADSTLAFTSTGTGYMSFAGTIRMTGRNKEKYPTFSVSYNGLYDEDNGYTASFSSSKLDYSLETVPTYIDGYGYSNVLTLLCYGEAVLKTFLNGNPLDNVTTIFKGDGIDFGDNAD